MVVGLLRSESDEEKWDECAMYTCKNKAMYLLDEATQRFHLISQGFNELYGNGITYPSDNQWQKKKVKTERCEKCSINVSKVILRCFSISGGGESGETR